MRAKECAVERPMKITFDSSAWRMISALERSSREPFVETFEDIGKAAGDGRITPFLCETIFVLEAMLRKKREEFFSEYKLLTGMTMGVAGISFSIDSDETGRHENRGFLEKRLKNALDEGFRILRLPRIADVARLDIESRFYRHDDPISYLDKAFEIARAMDSRGAGFIQIKELGQKYGTHWMDGIEQAPEQEAGNIAGAIAEWGNGDSVACHIALGGDYFCVGDRLRDAGERSIFSRENLDWLKEKYDFQIVSPEELVRMIDADQSPCPADLFPPSSVAC